MKLTPAQRVYRDSLARGWRLDAVLTVSEWADEHRILSNVASAEPGRWRTLRTPYLREIMDCLSSGHSAQRVVLMKGAQVGGTEAGNNWIGYIMHHSPGPTLLVEPTVEVAKRVSKQRIQPMIDSTPALRERVSEQKSRDSDNTIQSKRFEGGILIMTGANSSAGLRSMPIKNLFMDEVDDYPGDVNGQGDPCMLAEKRTSTFIRKKLLYVSTPTVKGISRIEREYATSDRRRYFIPCPKCGHKDYLTWRDPDHHRIEWDGHDCSTARMVCGSCNERVPESSKTEMLMLGEWRPTNPDPPTATVGFHLSALYSPLGWKSWAECVEEFISAKDDRFKLKTWVNTVLGETWEEEGASVTPHSLRARLEDFNGPLGVGAVVAAVDVQDNRLEAVVKGYGDGEESWLLAFRQFFGDPAQSTVWMELDQFLSKPFEREDGKVFPVECVVVDSGGHHTEDVYRYCAARMDRRVYAIKGGSESGKPLVGRPTMTNKYHTPLFVLCVDTGKDMVLARLQITAPGHGYFHLPKWVDEEYLAQLTAEKAVRRYVKGRGAVREWVKTRERNEAFDLEVYALAAMHILVPAPEALRALSARPAPPGAAPGHVKVSGRRGPWATRF